MSGLDRVLAQQHRPVEVPRRSRNGIGTGNSVSQSPDDWTRAMSCLLNRPDEELQSTDLAEVNLVTACGLPGAEDLDVLRYCGRLGAWVELVRRKTECWWPKFLESPAAFDDSGAKFQMMALVTVLQRDLGVHYNAERQEGVYDATDSRMLFIHGLLDGQGGTCVTLPVLYAAIGRRLGYPLKLVQAKEHLFVRWQEPGGERFNIGATTLGFTPRDDDHFRKWPKAISEEEVCQGLFLRNLTPREELATFLRERGQCWLDNLRTGPGLESFYQAARLGPRLPGMQCAWAIATMIHRVVEERGRENLLSHSDSIYECFPFPQEPWEHQVLPLAIEHLKRIIDIHRSTRVQ